MNHLPTSQCQLNLSRRPASSTSPWERSSRREGIPCTRPFVSHGDTSCFTESPGDGTLYIQDNWLRDNARIPMDRGARKFI